MTSARSTPLKEAVRDLFRFPLVLVVAPGLAWFGFLLLKALFR